MRSLFINALLDAPIQPDSHQTCERQIQTMAKLSIPLALRTEPSTVYLPQINVNRLLDELLFWLVKYQIPERLLKFFLMLLTDLQFKKAMLPVFLQIYGMAVAQWSQARGSAERRHSLQLVHLSVQLFSNGQLAKQAIEQHHLLDVMLSSLFTTFSAIKTTCQLQNPQENYHLIISERSFSKSMHYWPLISDWINVLSHPFASRTFITDQRYFITWIEMISWFQGEDRLSPYPHPLRSMSMDLGMNVHHRYMNSASLIDVDSSYSFAFNAETECCATTLWTIISQLLSPVSLRLWRCWKLHGPLSELS